MKRVGQVYYVTNSTWAILCRAGRYTFGVNTSSFSAIKQKMSSHNFESENKESIMDPNDQNGMLSKANVLEYTKLKMESFLKMTKAYPSEEHWEIIFNKVVGAMKVGDIEKIGRFLYKAQFGEPKEEIESTELVWKMWGDLDSICNGLAQGLLKEAVSKETGKKEFVSKGGDYEFRWRENGFFCETGATMKDVVAAVNDGSLLRTMLRSKGMPYSKP